MQFAALPIPDVILFTPTFFGDERGFFYESFNARVFEKATGQVAPIFVQNNHSRSTRGVLRGLHYQLEPFAQGKLVRVVSGKVFDVAVDIRPASPTFGRWTGHELSAENRLQLWIPAGFAHGFVTLSESAEFLYQTDGFYSPEHERCIAWNDPDIGVDWHYAETPQLSAKDLQGAALAKAEVFE